MIMMDVKMIVVVVRIMDVKMIDDSGGHYDDGYEDNYSINKEIQHSSKLLSSFLPKHDCSR